MHKILYLLLSVLAFCLINPDRGRAADFTVNPVKVSFAAGQRTSIITVKNQSADSLTLQLSAYSWEQDREGKDVYTPSDEIIMFPKILSLERDEERIIRVGIKSVQGNAEKSFRIYLEEIQDGKTRSEGAVLRTLMRVGVPVFISPVTALHKGSIEQASLSKGFFSFTLRNNGNLHSVIKTIRVNGFDKAGGRLFQTDFGGWYLLEGKVRIYSAEVPADICSKVVRIVMEVQADGFTLKEHREVNPAQCSP